MRKSIEIASTTHSDIEVAIGYVRDSTAIERRRGALTKRAIFVVATLFGITPSRAKSLFYRENLWRIAQDEMARIEAGFIAHLDREIALSIEYTEQLRAKRNEIRGRTVCENAASSQATYGTASIRPQCSWAA